MSKSTRLGIRIVIAVALLVGLVWICLPSMVIDYLDPCAQAFISAVGSARDLAGRYPASLGDVGRYLEMESQVSCSVESVKEGQYYVEWRQPHREVCRLMVVYRVDTAGNLEEYNVHRIDYKPD